MKLPLACIYGRHGGRSGAPRSSVGTLAFAVLTWFHDRTATLKAYTPNSVRLLSPPVEPGHSLEGRWTARLSGSIGRWSGRSCFVDRAAPTGSMRDRPFGRMLDRSSNGGLKSHRVEWRRQQPQPTARTAACGVLRGSCSSLVRPSECSPASTPTVRRRSSTPVRQAALTGAVVTSRADLTNRSGPADQQ
jgi:hypothetical protein